MGTCLSPGHLIGNLQYLLKYYFLSLPTRISYMDANNFSGYSTHIAKSKSYSLEFRQQSHLLQVPGGQNHQQSFQSQLPNEK